MIIGVDFDNTIVSYDAVFHRAARERGWIPSDIPARKTAVRDFLRRNNREEQWTELQGHVYGKRMSEAVPFEGALDFFRRCQQNDIAAYIISHRTRTPIQGDPCDLHAAGLDWLQKHGFADFMKSTMENRVYFELTKTDKLRRITEMGCTHFIDDLPEFLSDPTFPSDTQRVLFSPEDKLDESLPFPIARSWAEIEHILFAVSPLLDQVGLRGPFLLTPLRGGSNNRVFRVETRNGATLLKQYFHHPDDMRDRLGTEFAFATFAWTHGLRCIPKPLVCDSKKRLGLFEYIEGQPLQADDVNEDAVNAALLFFSDLNRHKNSSDAAVLPLASEACFSLAEHLQSVERRVMKLQMIEDKSAQQFVRDELMPAWNKIVKSIPADDAPIPLAERCLSPSDFGFHNALRGMDGRIRFLDFEYAGWDDPAKLVCDFFCQPAVPVSSAYLKQFTREVAGDQAEKRITLLLPLYRVKWCCILLNEFLPTESTRRRFARGKIENKKHQQLEKARQRLYTTP